MQLLKSKKAKFIVSSLAGIFVGFLNGFFGGGGGMIVVPVLIFLLSLEEKQAHATAIFCILPLSITSSIIYITKGEFDFFNLGFATLGVVIGGIMGSLLLKKMNNKVLRIIFALIMIIAGVKLMF